MSPDAGPGVVRVVIALITLLLFGIALGFALGRHQLMGEVRAAVYEEVFGVLRPGEASCQNPTVSVGPDGVWQRVSCVHFVPES